MKYLIVIKYHVVMMVFLGVMLSGCSLSFHTGPMPDEPANATFHQVKDARVRYIDVGKGPVVVLIHGFASSLETWTMIVPLLARNHRVIAMDLKGFGWTDRPEGDYSPSAQSEMVFGLLDHLKVNRMALVAHSWGCAVALMMVLTQPERISRIALYNAWVYEDQLPTFFYWARLDGLGELLMNLFYDERAEDKIAKSFYNEHILTEHLVEEVEKAFERPGTLAASLAAIRGHNFSEIEVHYKTIKQPVLLLWGREDGVATLSSGERLANDLANARLIVYSRCGHFPMIEAAASSNHDLIDFLSEVNE